MKGILVLVCLIALPASALADTESDARALLATWVTAQTDRDFLAYGSLYAKSFVGIRRTADGAEKRMKLKAWKADRKKMFKLKKVEVVADNPVVTASDTGATITFLQRWRGGGYADHGTKVLSLEVGTSGALQIVGEELLSSTPGWEDDPDAVVDATAMTSPITVRLKAEWSRNTDLADCGAVTFVLYVKDKKGKTTQRELGKGYLTGTDVDEDARTLAIAPSTTAGLLYEAGAWCAGAGEYYQVKRSGDAVTVLYRWNGEGDIEGSKWATTFTLQLPPGAKVKAK